MSQVEDALAALGGEPDVSADLPSAQVPADVLALAREAARAQDTAHVATAAAKAAKERAADLASDLKAAMQEFKLASVPLPDRDAVTLTAHAAKKGKPQNSMKGIIATLEASHEATLREQWEAIDGLSDEPPADAVKEARETGKKVATDLWKALPRSIMPGGHKLAIPKAPEVDEPE